MSDFKTVPLDTFNQSFCVVCANGSCARSASSTGIFGNRAANWKSMLFDNVPRAKDEDHSFDNIRAKKFLPTVGAIPTVNTPNFLSTSPVPQVVAPTPPSPPKFQGPVTWEEESEEPEEPSEQAAPPIQPALPPVPVSPPNTNPGNTPFIPDVPNTSFTQGAMLPRPEGVNNPPADKGPVTDIGQAYTFGDDDDE